jgi:hypothetical protein
MGRPIPLLHWRMLLELTAEPMVCAAPRQVTGLVAQAQAAALAGAPLALAASASAARRRRQLLSTTLAPQQARRRLCMGTARCPGRARKDAWRRGARAWGVPQILQRTTPWPS